MMGDVQSPAQLAKLDSRPINTDPDDIFVFGYVRNEMQRLPYFLEYHRKQGVNRFFLIDNESDDGTREYLIAQRDCHCFHASGSTFANNVYPPNWTNTLLNVFGDGHWCINMDADELLVYPDCESVSLPALCRYIETSGGQGMLAPLLDMYCDGPVKDATYSPGESFIDAAPFFDAKPGRMVANDGQFPAQLMMGGMRERVFWHGRFKRTNPPCLTKVPLVKWRRGMKYVIAQHMVTRIPLSDVSGALLHFKFLTGFQVRTQQELERNDQVKEKSLEEREAYAEAFAREPTLRMKWQGSARFQNSRQLVELGWIASSPAYERFAKNLNAEEQTPPGRRVSPIQSNWVT